MELIDKNELISNLILSNKDKNIIDWIKIQKSYDSDEMKLKDEIAIKAMVAMINYGETNERDPKYLSNKSYDIADAMIRRRKLHG